MTQQGYNPLDDLFLDNQQNVQGVIGYLAKYEQNEERQKQLQQQGRANEVIAADLFLLDVEIYKSNYPTGVAQHLLQFYVNTQRESTSGAYFEFTTSLKNALRNAAPMQAVNPRTNETITIPSDGAVQLWMFRNKYMNLRWVLKPSRAQVDGTWQDVERGTWVVMAVGDSKDAVRLPDDASWGGTSTTSTKTENPLLGGGLAGQAEAPVPNVPAQGEQAPASVPASATPVMTQEELVLSLADGKSLVEFQLAVFSSAEAAENGLSDRVMSGEGGVGVLAPFVADGRLVADDTGKYRRVG